MQGRHTAQPRRRVTASNWCGVVNQQVTHRPTQFEFQNLTDYRGKNGPFYRGFGPYCACTQPQRCGHPAGIVHGTATMDGKCLRHLLHTLGRRAHRIGLLDQYRSPTKYKKVMSCNIYMKAIMDDF